MTLEERISTIAARMTVVEPFLGTVFTKLERIVEDDDNVTAWTDGTRVGFGRAFCDALDNEVLLGIALHEVGHVAFMHPWRRDGRDPELWNIANDAVINRQLLRSGYKLPEGTINFGWVTDEMSSEEVYVKLLENRPPPQDGGGNGVPGDGEPSDGKPRKQRGLAGDLRDAPDDAGKADMEATITTAAKMAKACGSRSAFVDRVLSGELTPTVPWQDVLREVMQSAARDDYSYRRFNRRFISQGIYMPSLYSEAMGGLVIGVDTSGSVSDRELSQIASEINAVFEDCSPDWIEVVYCDAEVKSTQRFNQGDHVQLKPNGGGGTAFKPVFDYVAKMGERVAAIVYLTDLYGNVNELEQPECPVVWGVINRSQMPTVPFGNVVGVHV